MNADLVPVALSGLVAVVGCMVGWVRAPHRARRSLAARALDLGLPDPTSPSLVARLTASDRGVVLVASVAVPLLAVVMERQLTGRVTPQLGLGLAIGVSSLPGLGAGLGTLLHRPDRDSGPRAATVAPRTVDTLLTRTELTCQFVAAPLLLTAGLLAELLGDRSSGAWCGLSILAWSVLGRLMARVAQAPSPLPAGHADAVWNGILAILTVRAVARMRISLACAVAAVLVLGLDHTRHDPAGVAAALLGAGIGLAALALILVSTAAGALDPRVESGTGRREAT